MAGGCWPGAAAAAYRATPAARESPEGRRRDVEVPGKDLGREKVRVELVHAGVMPSAAQPLPPPENSSEGRWGLGRSPPVCTEIWLPATARRETSQATLRPSPSIPPAAAASG